MELSFLSIYKMFLVIFSTKVSQYSQKFRLYTGFILFLPFFHTGYGLFNHYFHLLARKRTQVNLQ